MHGTSPESEGSGGTPQQWRELLDEGTGAYYYCKGLVGCWSHSLRPRPSPSSPPPPTHTHLFCIVAVVYLPTRRHPPSLAPVSLAQTTL